MQGDERVLQMRLRIHLGRCFGQACVDEKRIGHLGDGADGARLKNGQRNRLEGGLLESRRGGCDCPVGRCGGAGERKMRPTRSHRHEVGGEADDSDDQGRAAKQRVEGGVAGAGRRRATQGCDGG